MSRGECRETRHINWGDGGDYLWMCVPVAHKSPSTRIGLRDLLPATFRVQLQPRPTGSIDRIGRGGASQYEPSLIAKIDKELPAALCLPRLLAMPAQKLRHATSDQQLDIMGGPPPAPSNIAQDISSWDGQSLSRTLWICPASKGGPR